MRVMESMIRPNLRAKCAAIGARKGSCAKSPCRREIKREFVVTSGRSGKRRRGVAFGTVSKGASGTRWLEDAAWLK